MRAWRQHSGEIRGWLLKRNSDVSACEDLLQDVFFKAFLQQEQFCSLENARAWLFRVASNAWIDQQRLRKHQVPVPDNLSQQEEVVMAVDELSGCIPRVLSELAQADREAIIQCDLNGMSQREYADMKGITLVAAKSRLQRARKRLKKQLETACQIQRDASGTICCFVPRPPLK